MSRATVTVTTTRTATTAATVIATATETKKTMIPQSYRAWQVPALGSRGAAIRSFLFKQTEHFKVDGNDDSDSKSKSNSDGNDKDISVI